MYIFEKYMKTYKIIKDKSVLLFLKKYFFLWHFCSRKIYTIITVFYKMILCTKDILLSISKITFIIHKVVAILKKCPLIWRDIFCYKEQDVSKLFCSFNISCLFESFNSIPHVKKSIKSLSRCNWYH